MQTQNIEEMCARVSLLKAEESRIKAERMELEASLSSSIATKLEGTDKFTGDKYRVTVTSKLTRSLDYDAYREIEEGIPEGVRFVDLKPSINLEKLRALELVDPSISAHCIATKPAKAAVKVEVIQ